MGGNLTSWMEKKKVCKELEAAVIMKQLLSAIVYLHSKNIAHRDIKPENLLFESHDENSTLKVIDFGTSHTFHPRKKMTSKIGTPMYVAPEVIKGSYTEKCDIWSAGVVLYFLLSGNYPFFARNESDLYRKIQRGIYSLGGPRWNGISKEAKELIRSMLTKDPNKRCTALEALNNPWVKQSYKHKLNISDAKTQLNDLRDFKATHKLQQAALTFIVSQLISNREKERFHKMFLMLDDNNDGKVSKDELIKGFKKIFGEGYQTQTETQKIIDEIDLDGSGFIDLTEFVIATMNKKKLLSKDKLMAAFDMFDKDRSGAISANEIKDVLQQEVDIPDENWNQLIEEVDQNGDGVISLDEFTTMMYQLLNKSNVK